VVVLTMAAAQAQVGIELHQVLAVRQQLILQ
jgi:hypothetical protein